VARLARTTIRAERPARSRVIEPVSKIAKHDFHAAEADHAEEVLDVVLPARDQAAKIVQPGEEPLYRPASSITTQGASILSRVLPVSAMGRDHLDVVLCPQVVVQGIAVVGFVSNQPGRELAEEAVPPRLFDELAFVRRSSLDTDGDRKTVASGDSRDLGPFPALGRADAEPPFFAAAKVASMKASSRFSRPSARNRSARTRSACSSAPERTHC